MKITLLQTDIRWNSPRENKAAVERLMDANPGADLYVLPEMWATGFDTSPADAPRQGEWALQAMGRMARERGCTVAGGITAEGQGRLYNRFCLVAPDGHCVFYDKRHLFAYGGEDRLFAPGTRRVVARCGGLRLLLQTCYDLRFPVFARNRGDYDMILYIASWPESRQAAWETLLRARAIENQCFVCGVNRTGSDPQCRYAGGSACIDAYGRTLLDLGSGEAAGTVEPDMERLRQFRQKFPVLHDADDFRLLTDDAPGQATAG